LNIVKNTVVTISYRLSTLEGDLLKEAGGNEPAIYLHGGYDGIFPKVEATLKGVRMATEDEIAHGRAHGLSGHHHVH